MFGGVERNHYICNGGYSNRRCINHGKAMKFYDREKETEALRRIERLSAEYAQMTVITGRRRIGKTTLVKHACGGIPTVYFFVGRKSESLLCRELCEIVERELGVDLGDFSSFGRLFSALMRLSADRNFTLVLDEFQNFRYASESVFSDIQNAWDAMKDNSRINLILCGSVYSMMAKIFDDRREPLYGRATNRLRLRPFSTTVLKEILHDCNPEHNADDLLTFYMITGGVAKYVEQFVSHHTLTKEAMIDEVFSVESYFVPEGSEMLSDEFGREYGNYFSIISAVANGETTRGAIKSYTGIETGGYLDRLEKNYDILQRRRPYLAAEGGKNVSYSIRDNFLLFWFRFVYKYRSAIEIGNTEYVRERVMADYDTFSGYVLERYFRQKYAETGMYDIVTNYWGRNGENEIDLVAVNEADRETVIGEVKRNRERISLPVLREKARGIMQRRPSQRYVFVALSPEDM